MNEERNKNAKDVRNGMASNKRFNSKVLSFDSSTGELIITKNETGDINDIIINSDYEEGFF